MGSHQKGALAQLLYSDPLCYQCLALVRPSHAAFELQLLLAGLKDILIARPRYVRKR
jgi:hypothetical protein